MFTFRPKGQQMLTSTSDQRQTRKQYFARDILRKIDFICRGAMYENSNSYKMSFHIGIIMSLTVFRLSSQKSTF